jgi:cytochrome c2
MPSSLRFVLLLFVLAALSAPVSVYLIERQDSEQARTQAEALTGGHVDAGKSAILRYGCAGCHQIPGVEAAEGKVGPSLKGLAVRAEIAGKLPNQPDKLMLWLRHPQAVDPGNGMPEMGVTPRDARDMAAYLYTLRK